MQRRHIRLSHCPRRQRGAVALLAALSILILLTVMTIISAQISTVEQRVAGNELRERQAFEAAMTGYEHAMAYIAESGPDADDPGDAGYGTADTIAAPSTNPASRASVTGGGTYAVELCDPVAWSGWISGKTALEAATASCPRATKTSNGLERILIYARGWSDDSTGIRHIVSVLEKTPGVAEAPGYALTTHGTAAINGSGDVTNPEGTSTIWSGQTVTITNANFKTNILNTTGNIVETSNRDSFGLDVFQNDGSLATLTGDQFFANFFGTTPADFEANYATEVFSPGDIGDYDGAEREILWSDGDTSTSGNTTFGTADNPVILIINGDLDVAGNITVNGLLYVIGDMTGNGNTTVNGAVIVQGNTDITGSFDVVFNSSLLGNLGAVGRPVATPGSWKDWWKES